MTLVKFEPQSDRVKTDNLLPGPSPDWVSFMGIPYEPADRAVGDRRSWMAAGRVSNWVDRCVNIHVNNIAQVPYELRAGTPKKYTVVEDHPILDILARPNPFDMQDWGDMCAAIVRSALLRGEDFFNVVRNNARLPAELYWMNPDTMRPIPDPRTFVDGFWLDAGSRSVRLETDEVYWWRVFNTLDRYHGYSRIESLRRSINLDVSAVNVQQSVYANGSLARGIVYPDDKEGVGFNKTAMDEMQLEWQERASGSRNAHSIMFFSKPIKFQELGLKADEAQWLETRAAARMEIASQFGIPLEIATSESKSYDNLRSARLSLWHEELIPELDWVAKKINATIVRDYDPGGARKLFLAFRVADVPALQPDLQELQRMENDAIRHGRRTINEIRRVHGEDDVPWGDGYWAPVTYVDLSKGDGTPFARTTQTIQVPSAGSLKPVPPSGSELVEEDLVEPVDAGVLRDEGPAAAPAATPPPATVQDVAVPPAKRRKGAVAVIRTPEQRAVVGERHARVLASSAGVMADTIHAAWERQRDAILARLPAKRKALVDVDDVLVPAVADLFAASSRMFDEAGTQAYESVADQIRDARTKGRKDGVDIAFQTDNPALQALARELGVRITGIDDTTLADVRDALEEGLRRGYSIPQIADGVPGEDYPGIRGLFDDYWPGRAETIARTETAWAFSRASMQAYRDSGVVDQKEWMLGMGDAEGICQELDGEVVGVDDTFSDGSDAPPDPHPNCTCSLLPVITAAEEAPDDEDGGSDSGDAGDEGELAMVELATRVAVGVVRAMRSRSRAVPAGR